MNLSDFDFELPQELIAQYPLPSRSGSRLLCLEKSTGDISHRQFIDIIDYISANDLLVFNDTRVIPARLYGRKFSGGKLEFLIERVLNEKQALAHIKASKAPNAGTEFIIAEKITGHVLGREHGLFLIEFSGEASVFDLLNSYGHIPLPPYITRADDIADQERYQTVYAKNPGAVAAPTAGLHFDEAILTALNAKGVAMGFVTLHVGAGTFQPVRVDDISNHQMHKEYLEVSSELCQQIAATKQRGGRVIAVGTTSVRALETAARVRPLQAFAGDTDIFIYPGYDYKVVDAILTNFHLPQSTLIMLIAAFAGLDKIKQAYQVAIEQAYRFFSYGDAMLIM